MSRLHAFTAMFLSCLFLFFTGLPTSGSTLANRTTSADPQPWMLKDINPGSPASYPYGFLYLNGRTLFVAADSDHGSELWSTDGTPGGTKLLVDINQGAAEGVSWGTPLDPQAVANGVLYFTGTDPQHGRELWRTDGTAQGTWMVKDIVPGAASSDPDRMINVNGVIFVSALNAFHGWDLWKTNGSSAGTLLVKNILPDTASFDNADPIMAALGNSLIFVVNDYVNGRFQLWRSDGTAAGTVPFFGPYLYGSNPLFGDSVRFMETHGGRLYLNLNMNDYNGDRLWVTDGTTQGTKPIWGGPPAEGTEYNTPSLPDHLTWIGSSLYFTAIDLTANGNPLGYGLWKLTEGSLTADQVIGPVDAAISGLTRLNPDHMLYWQYNPGSSKYSLWTTDGTAAGAENICPDCFGEMTEQTAAMVGRVYFTADNQLWVTDGTSAGTKSFSGFTPNLASNKYQIHFAAYANRLFFAADDGSHGDEPWMVEVELPNHVYLPKVER